MDWKNQNKFTKTFIIILIILNVVTISMMWILMSHGRMPPPFFNKIEPRGAIELMRRDLNLSDNQVEKFEKLRMENFDKSKLLMNRADELKKRLSEELANDKIDTAKANSIANEIGSIYAQIEKKRFDHFAKLIALCTPEQQAKLKPILKNIISNKQKPDLPGLDHRFPNDDKFSRPPNVPRPKPNPMNTTGDI